MKKQGFTADDWNEVSDLEFADEVFRQKAIMRREHDWNDDDWSVCEYCGARYIAQCPCMGWVEGAQKAAKK